MKPINAKYTTIFPLLTILILTTKPLYASWYEEPEVYETENVDNMWWLSKSKKEKIKIEQQKEIEKRIIENKSRNFCDKKIKWLYDNDDITNFPKDKWELIDDDNDGAFYNYYFNKDGYLLIDTVTPDYRVVDNKGREVDYNFRPIKYNIEVNDTDGIATYEKETYTDGSRETAKVLLTEGVVLGKRERIYDNSLNKNVTNYVDKSDRFTKDTKGITYNEIMWKKCSSLKGNGGYVVFNNPKNNFNGISGYITTAFETHDSGEGCILRVYDADLYDKYYEINRLDDLDYIYLNNDFYQKDPVKFSFTFDRSVKRLRFEIEALEGSKSLTCYFKDLKYGFNKKEFYEELVRKKDEEEEIEKLKQLGIYLEDMWELELLDEDYNDKDDEETENENNDDRIGGVSYVSEEETKSYEDVVRDRNTGPAFDEELKNIKEVGPGIIE